MQPDLSVKELATQVGVHPFTVWRWARSGKLPGAYQTLGGLWRFTPKALDAIRGGRFNTRTQP